MRQKMMNSLGALHLLNYILIYILTKVVKEN